MQHPWGTYISNEGDPELDRAMSIAGSGWYTILDHQAGKGGGLERIKREQPEADVLVRFYLKNWYRTDPRTHAQRIRDAFFAGPNPFINHTKRFTWANEQNLASESEGILGADTGGREPSWQDYETIAWWNEAVLDELDKFPECDQLIKHYPALAPGHGEDWARDGNHNPLPGYPLMDNGEPTPSLFLMARGINRCHVLNWHPYTLKGCENKDKWRGVERIELVHALFPHKKIFVDETGNFDVTNDRAPDQILDIGYRLQGKSYVIGFTPFILNSPDPGHNDNNWSRNHKIEEVYSKSVRISRDRSASPTPGAGIVLPSHLPTPQPTPTVPAASGPQFVLGFEDFYNVLPTEIGNAKENEGPWHVNGRYVGQGQETTNGVLLWHKESNQKFFINHAGNCWTWNNGEPRYA